MTSSARTYRTSPAPVRRRVGGSHRGVEAMESRILFHLDVQTPIPDQTVFVNSGPTAVNLNEHLFDEAVPGPTVRFSTSRGDFDVVLTERETPITVANFLNYVESGRYDGTVIHRSEPGPPPFVIQGGGYFLDTSGGTAVGRHITTDAPIVNEFSPSRPNLRGTIAMAKTSDPNSATSEWFVNLSDNASLDSPTNSGGFTTFGRVTETGMLTVDGIAALRRANATPVNSAWNNLPVINESLPDHPTPTTVGPGDVVTVNSATVVSPVYSIVSNDNPGLVTPTLTNRRLTFTYVPGAVGTANVTVRATNEAGVTVDDVVQVTVTPPEITVGPGGSARMITYTEADGTAGVIRVGGGVAGVRFRGTEVNQTTTRGVLNVTGNNLEIDSIAVNSGAPSITVRSLGGGDNRLVVNGITTGGTLRSFNGREVVLRGASNVGGGLGRLNVLATEGATLTLAGLASAGGANITIGTATDTDITSSAPIRSLRIGGWAGADTEPDVITAPSINSFQSGGDFGGDVVINGASSTRNLNNARVSGAITGGTWNVTGLAGNVAAESIRSAWQAVFGGPVNNIAVTGDLSGNINGSAIRNIRAGSVTGATVTLSRAPGTGPALNSLNSRGLIANTNINSAGDIGTITAGAIADSTVFAGVTPPDGGALPDSADDFPASATLRNFTIRNRATASFTNTDLAAANIGRANLGVVNTANAGVPFGVAALAIGSIGFADTTGARTNLARLDDPVGGREFGDFKLRLF